MSEYARVPRGRINHVVVDGGVTACGKDIKANRMAVWPMRLNNRVDYRPTCDACREAMKA